MVANQQELGLPVSLYIAEDYLTGGHLLSLLERELFYIAQEAVVNALKHGQANHISPQAGETLPCDILKHNLIDRTVCLAVR